MVKPSQTVGPHYDQIHCLRFGKTENLVRHCAILHVALGLYPAPAMYFRKLLKLVLGIGAKFPADLIVGVRKSIVRIVGGQRFYHLLQEESSLVMPSRRLRIVVSVHREFREVNGTKDALKLQHGFLSPLLFRTPE